MIYVKKRWRAWAAFLQAAIRGVFFRHDARCADGEDCVIMQCFAYTNERDGVPRFSSSCHNASLVTRGYAFSISYKVRTTGVPVREKQISSTRRRVICTTSSTDRFFRKPCCSSSINVSENFCRRLATIRATIFAPTLKRVVPRQLPLLDLGCFFFQSGITIACSQSSGHSSASASSVESRVASQTCWTRWMSRLRSAFGAH